ncbi:transporter substrate-binding domain-containing protein [Piscinibacter sp. XHJ-5]|uniref:substrate-binding periplasmic protein n=1 Tax=Piscinibacter sp. XHJ-5 TaxID=3037797 RepID=UPI002452C523|nr:transporter substrate-binding domain-containing protein [Piscinibacter sp. XHJ-5]
MLHAIRTSVTALCLCLAGLVAMAAEGPERPVVRACGHHDYPPWNWMQDQRIVGVCAAVAQRAIERLGYRVDLSYVGPWKRCQALIEAGQIDVNICAFRNRDRERYSVFAEPRMAQNRIAVFVQKQRAPQMPLRTWTDLKGLRIGLVAGVSMGLDFDTFLEQHTEVQRTTDMGSVLRMLARHRVDAVPFGREAGLLQVDHHRLAGEIVPLASDALVGDLFVSVSRSSPLAARIGEIGAYFARPSYPEELERLFAEYHRLYLQRSADTQPPPVR